MPRSSRQPTVERRSHRRSDGTTTDSWSVRYYDVRGVRRRRSFASVEEADFERARLALLRTLQQLKAESARAGRV